MFHNINLKISDFSIRVYFTVEVSPSQSNIDKIFLDNTCVLSVLQSAVIVGRNGHHHLSNCQDSLRRGEEDRS